jgi:hypothetical protein
MTQIAIHRLHARLRLPAAGADEAGRLERLLAEMVERALEPALQQIGIADSGELCIRRVDVPTLRLDLGATDGVLVERWARVWAGAIAKRIGRDDAGVVRYRSRVHALIDLVDSATRGDFSRAWAWRRLGLWNAGSAVTGSDAAGLVMRALTSEPSFAVHALATLAAKPTNFARWLRKASTAELRGLALAVLRAGGGDPAALHDRPPDRAAVVLPGAASRLLRRSVLARALAQMPPSAPSVRAPALAVLAVAESEPALLRSPVAELRALLDVMTTAWAGTDTTAERDAFAARPSNVAPSRPHGRDTSIETVDDRVRPRGTQLDIGASNDDSGTGPTPPTARTGSAAGGAARPDGPRQPGSHRRWVAPEAGTEGNAADDASSLARGDALADAVADPRCASTTAFGGLLFLVNLARDLGWPDRLLGDPVLAARGLRWSVHQLAQVLLPIGPDDPAALAFAGLRPGDEKPAHDQPPPAEAETAAVEQLRTEVVGALRLRLPGADGDDAQLVASVCRRRAEILADPGWFEVHLSLDDVRSEIRVAGLDLDPGWLPWLGVVIRFVYE